MNKKYFSLAVIVLLATSLLLLGTNQDSSAHRSGCHRWHSCPSDTGSYVCGDLGYDTYCPKSEQPRSSGSSSSGSSSSGSSTSKSTQSSKPADCKGTKLCVNGIIRKIIDGDTLVVDRYTVRLSLTNTPEKGESGFKEATSFTSKLCQIGSYALVDQDDGQPFDKYNRLVGKVTCSEKILNVELLDNGHANILTQYCKKSEFAAESWAKEYGC